MAFQSQSAAPVISKLEEYDLNITLSQQRISQLFTTNERPQDHELALIRPVAHKTTARLACLEAEMSRLKDQLGQLEEEHCVLMACHTRNATILSPTRRIPVEILSEIFSWSLPSFRLPSVRNAPWNLARVSRRWRAIALAQSSLWSRICLDFSLSKTYSLAMVQTQIERACTLKIKFIGSHRSDSRPQVDMLQVLLRYSSIWEEICIVLTTALVIPMAACRGRLPLLQRAWLQWDGPESQANIDSIDFLTVAPSLADITVRSHHHFMPTLFPVHHLLTRYAFHAPWKTHYELLKSSPNLHEVRISRNFDQGVPWPVPGEPIRLSHLRSIYVSHVESLDYLSAPVLEEIAIRSQRRVDTQSHLAPFVTRSSCVLRKLCMVGLPDVQSTEEILNQYPSITELAVRIMDAKKNLKTEHDVLLTFFPRFTISDSARISPHISKLDFECHNVHVIPYTLYVDMLDSRWKAPDCALTASELLLPNTTVDPDPESLARMETLREGGMRVSFFSGRVAEERADRWVYVASWVV
ncbi:F-box domain-containing protein [Mycena sanguinolenta]|uniref:F-box domain-containing protein n=1 Tax=Mycena sanguinolenta TaxID=230812 RepID=A0A8H6XNR5_9AGAR|nr:F-box domain-containing protein [Mycena sanguinolenta]